MTRLVLVLIIAGAWRGCVAPAGGPIARSLDGAAAEASVPAELVKAIAVEEGGLGLREVRAIDPDDNVPVAGRLELRRGRIDTLALGAELLGVTEDALRIDTDLGTRAGAQVLAHFGSGNGAGVLLVSWRRALEVMSGLDDWLAADYASRVLGILRTGGSFPARGGETITIAAHPEIPESAVLELLSYGGSTPDYPNAIWFATDCTNKCVLGRPQGYGSVDKIVIHDTEGDWDASVATLQFDPGKSVHYIVDADGSRVGQFVAETVTSWNSGNRFYNETSISIEHVGRMDDPAGYARAMYDKSRDLVQNIRTRWKVPIDRQHIFGHYQVPDVSHIPIDSPPCPDPLAICETSDDYGGTNHHRDPGLYWDWCQYMEHLGGSCTCNDTRAQWTCTTDQTEAMRCADGKVEIRQCGGGCSKRAAGDDDVCSNGGGCAVGGTAGPLLAIALLFMRRRRCPR